MSDKCPTCLQRAPHCRACDRIIRYVDGPLGGAWQHVHSMSIYCRPDSDDRATPTTAEKERTP